MAGIEPGPPAYQPNVKTELVVGYEAATGSKFFRRRDIVRRRMFVRCNGESSSKVNFVGK